MESSLPSDGDGSLLPVAWLSPVLGREVVSCKLDDSDLEKINQMSQMRWATVQYTGSSQERVVLKLSKPGDGKAISLGLAREGLFYAQWKDLLSKLPESTGSCGSEARERLITSFLPRVWYAEGDMETGSKKVLMEDLADCVQAGYFFGPVNPNNWGKDLEKEKKSLTLDAVEVTRLAFSAAAKLHASFWKCEALLAVEWLRSSSWHKGEGREVWEESQKTVKEGWSEIRMNIGKATNEKETINWDPLLVDCLDAAVAKISWEEFQNELQGRKAWFTLTHGDFHPANMMLKQQKQEPEATGVDLLLLDWEVVGLGSGPQDLGQFMISHVEASTRRMLEEGAVRSYYNELTLLNPDIAVAFSFDDCHAEYVHGGLGRWLWFIPVLAKFCPPKMTQCFADQVVAFIRDHAITPETVPMPRA